MTDHFSDLQVDTHEQYPKYLSSGLHKNGAHADSEHIYSDKIVKDEQAQLEAGGPHSQKHICGLAARTFWIVAAIISVIVIAAAVGGGVGGSLAGKSHSATPAAATTQSQTSSAATTSSVSAPVTTPPTSTTSTVSISTFTTVGPTETLLVDCPSSNNTLYSPPSSSELWRKSCGNSFLGNNINLVNSATVSLDDCITLAAAYNVENVTEIADGASNVCNAVCWRATIAGDDYPGVCFGFTTTNSSGGFTYATDDRCDSAALINQSF